MKHSCCCFFHWQWLNWECSFPIKCDLLYMQRHFCAVHKEIDGLCSLCGVYRAGKECFWIVKGTYCVILQQLKTLIHSNADFHLRFMFEVFSELSWGEWFIYEARCASVWRCGLCNFLVISFKVNKLNMPSAYIYIYIAWSEINGCPGHQK